MVFGDASFPPPKSSAGARVPSTTITSPIHVPVSNDTTNTASLLDSNWISTQLANLNQTTQPILSDAKLGDVYWDVISEVEDLIDRPLAEVWERVAHVLARELVLAKGAATTRGLKSTIEVADEATSVKSKKEGEVVGGRMAAPLLGQFLVHVNGFIQERHEKNLTDYLVLEPPFRDHYQRMIVELKQTFPKGSEDALEEKCAQYLKAAKEGAEGASWTPFIKFMVQYLGYLRDVDADPNKYLETYNLLSELQSRANSALTHGTLGYLILPVVITNARLVCRLAIGLDKQPQLIAHLKSQQSGGEDGGARETLPERAANILRQAFVTCLNDRTSVNAGKKPEGRKRGIYIIANMCLKILFQCRKTRNATQIFENIYNLSPPLSSYPKRERVTYLYYLGRFYFQNSHFYRAQLALQQAYNEAPARQECVRQRRHILVYLIASNIILGRFPSQALLSRPEARGLAERFLPICMAIRQGDLASFRRHLDLSSEHAAWFLHFRILLQLKNRCEVLVWRSLIRKTWILNGTRPDSGPASGPRIAPTVNMHDLIAVFNYLEKQYSSIPPDYTDPDFEGVDYNFDNDDQSFDITAIESILSSLIDQGFLSGFFSHRNQKFAITGAGKRPVLEAGFPLPWVVMRARAERDRVDGEVPVPGWKKEQKLGFGGAGVVKPGPGTIINLSNARPVGAFG